MLTADNMLPQPIVIESPPRLFQFSLRHLIVFVLVIGSALGLFLTCVLRAQKANRTHNQIINLFKIAEAYHVEHADKWPRMNVQCDSFWAVQVDPPTLAYFKRYYRPKDNLFNDDGIAIDGWGQPLRIKVGELGYPAEIWSCGPNGIDESGAGDDITLKEALGPP